MSCSSTISGQTYRHGSFLEVGATNDLSGPRHQPERGIGHHLATLHVVQETRSTNIPKCDTCNLAEAKRHGAGVQFEQPVEEVKNQLQAHALMPGDVVSCDQYESTVRGLIYHSNQVTLAAGDTIQTKVQFK